MCSVFPLIIRRERIIYRVMSITGKAKHRDGRSSAGYGGRVERVRVDDGGRGFFPRRARARGFPPDQKRARSGLQPVFDERAFGAADARDRP